jgi:hypothetical protein
VYQKRLREAEEVYFRYAPPQAFRKHSSLEKLPNPPFSGAAAWQCSVYYYWFLFMREHQRQTLKDRRKELRPSSSEGSAIQDAFGDVTAIGFLEWWIVRGRHLFCEPTHEGVRALEEREIDYGVDLPPGQRSRGIHDPHIYLKIPVHQDFDKSIEEVRHFLKQAKRVQQQSPKFGEDETAALPVFTKPVLTALEKAYIASQLRNDDPDMTLAEIAVRAGLAARPDNKDTANRSANASAASRALKQAALLTEWASKGVFPVTSSAQVSKAQKFADQIARVLAGPRWQSLQQAIRRGGASEPDLRAQAIEHGLDLNAVR